MFHWDNGLVLSKARLAVDFRRRQPRAFISHAHSDHIARHELAICTPATAALYQLRLGPRPTLPMPYRQTIDWGGLRLTAYPAGHCLGSAMLLAQDDDQSLLYTGDFKLGRSATAERAELPHADILVIESTYGTPRYRMPPREMAIDQLITLVQHTLDDGALPVIQAYILGKAQEVTRILTSADIPVLQHRKIFEVSRVYEECGVSLGRYDLFSGQIAPGWALIVPPGMGWVHQFDRQVSFVVTGWAIDPRAKYRFRVDHAIPLSDHADYDELLEAVNRVAPRIVYCTHGPESFVQCLLDAGHNAQPLGRSSQKRLF
ncbi:MAG: MBL fold metallo-hydrolase RNA specificity domain-containing protein [Thermoguttaceae bacterium]